MIIRHILIAKDCSYEFLESLKFDEQEMVVTHAFDLESFEKYFNEHLFDVIVFDLEFIRQYQQEVVLLLKNDSTQTPFVVLDESENKTEIFDFFEENAVGILRSSSEKHEMIRCFTLAFRLRDLNAKLEKLKEGSFINPETGLYESSYFEDRLASEFHRAQRYVFGLSVILIAFHFDPEDLFKKGHQYALWEKRISEMLLRFTRTNDIVVGTSQARFLLLFPDTNKKGAEIFAKRFLKAVSEVDWNKELKSSFLMKTSMGIASFPEDGVRKESALLELADKALEQASKSETNQIYSFQGMDVTGLLPGSIRQVKAEG